MKCDEIEELMPRYVEGDLSETDRRSVEAHLATCAGCRESLEAFTALELSLGGLKAAVPSWKTAEARFVREAGLAKKRSIPRLVFTAPVMAGFSFIAVGIAFFLRGDAILFALESLFARFVFSLDGLTQTGSRWFVELAGLDLTVLIGIYGSLLIALLAATRLLVMRFARK